MRILALDVGDKRIGLAVSDPLGLTAQPLQTLARGHFKKDCAVILAKIQAFQVTELVIGLPLDSEGNEGRQSEKIRFFAEGLEMFLNEHNIILPFRFVDESYSSKEAENILLEANMGRQKRKRVIDKIAAAVILQHYLDHEK